MTRKRGPRSKRAWNFRKESAESQAPVLVVDTDGMRPDKARQTLTAAMDCFEVNSVLTEEDCQSCQDVRERQENRQS